MTSKRPLLSKSLAENRKARFNYEIESNIECGIALFGSEVKSLRLNGGNIVESYANIEDEELWLINSYIPLYTQAKTFGHEERRRRKLLVKKKEFSKLWINLGRERMTLVPLKLYFNGKGKVKILVGIAKGKKVVDKRETEKKRDWQREKARLLKQS
jgi:SsrA-binding protein